MMMHCECVTVTGSGKLVKPPYTSTETLSDNGVDVMDLPITEKGSSLSRLLHEVATCIPSATPEGNTFSGATNQGSNSFLWGTRTPVV